MSGISSFPLNRRSAQLASMLPDKFTDSDVKSAYERMGQRGGGVAGIRDGWEEESRSLQEEALRMSPDVRLDALEAGLHDMRSRLDSLEKLARTLQRQTQPAGGAGGAFRDAKPRWGERM